MAVGGRDQAVAPPFVDIPRDPEFAAKAGRVLDLYHRRFYSTADRSDPST